jgi:hypothetical protein
MSTEKKRLRQKFRRNAPPAARPVPVEAAADDPGSWGPPDTAAAARLMPPPLENLRSRGLIAAEQYLAAQEIERVFHWLTAGLRIRTVDLHHIRGAVATGSDPLQAAYSQRYRPWADELSGAKTVEPPVDQMARVLRSVKADDLPRLVARRQAARRGRHHPKTLQFVIEFVIDDRTIETIARAEGHDHRTVKRAVLDGLTLYAEIAGWLRRAA